MENPFNLTIEKVVYGGDGLGHHEGKVVFVPYTLPKEEVVVVCQKSKKNFSNASLLRILSSEIKRLRFSIKIAFFISSCFSYRIC